MKTVWMTVALFSDQQAGKALEAFLKEKRIDARTYNDKSLEICLFLSPPQTVFHVQVRDPSYRMTLTLLNTDPPAVLQKAIHCPECGSIRISYPHLTRGSFLSTLQLNLGIIFRANKHQAYCEQCHCAWSLPKPVDAVAPEPRPHPGN
jgi:hypothetical protein